MFDPELVRTLCCRLLEEKDPARFKELSDCLQAIVSSSTDQLRLKLDYVARHYPNMVSEHSDLPPPKLWFYILK